MGAFHSSIPKGAKPEPGFSKYFALISPDEKEQMKDMRQIKPIIGSEHQLVYIITSKGKSTNKFRTTHSHSLRPTSWSFDLLLKAQQPKVI